MKNTLKIFEGTKVCWVGINSEEIIHMNEILNNNGGTVTTLDDANCTHVVSVLEGLVSIFNGYNLKRFFHRSLIL